MPSTCGLQRSRCGSAIFGASRADLHRDADQTVIHKPWAMSPLVVCTKWLLRVLLWACILDY